MTKSELHSSAVGIDGRPGSPEDRQAEILVYAEGKFESQQALGLTVLFFCEGNQPEVFFWGGRSNEERGKL